MPLNFQSEDFREKRVLYTEKYSVKRRNCHRVYAVTFSINFLHMVLEKLCEAWLTSPPRHDPALLWITWLLWEFFPTQGPADTGFERKGRHLSPLKSLLVSDGWFVFLMTGNGVGWGWLNSIDTCPIGHFLLSLKWEIQRYVENERHTQQGRKQPQQRVMWPVVDRPYRQWANKVKQVIMEKAGRRQKLGSEGLFLNHVVRPGSIYWGLRPPTQQTFKRLLWGSPAP